MPYPRKPRVILPASPVSGPDVLDIQRPRREEYMICTALAPDAVFTVHR